MNVRDTYIIGAVVLAVLLGGGAAVVTYKARGLRNNNPGNIRRSGDSWVGLSPTQTDSAFFQFTEMRYGVRASARIFRNYQQRYGLVTVAQLVSRWAPPSENDTAAYVLAVCARIGVRDGGVAIDLRNTETMYRFLRAIFRHENGIAAETVPESTIREGIALS